MQSRPVSGRILGHIGLALIGVISVAIERLPQNAAAALIASIRVFGRIVDRCSVHLIYRRSGRPVRLSGTTPARLR